MCLLLKLDTLLCLNHCRSAPLYILPFFRSWPPYFPPIHRLLAQNHRARTVARPELWHSTGSGACSDSWLCSCFDLARARALAQAETFSSSSSFRPPSSIPSVGQIACPSQPMAIAARSCQPMAIAARPY